MRNFAMLALTAALAACGEPGQGDRQTATQQTSSPAPIDPNAVIEMTPEQYPKMYARLGATDFARANTLSKIAAMKRAKDGECDIVDYVGVSDQSTPDDIQIFADCRNGVRRRYHQADLT